MGNCLKYYGLKDWTADRCDVCDRKHLNTVDVPGVISVEVRVQCDECVEAEKQLLKISEIISKTNRALSLLSPRAEEERAKLNEILKRNRQKRTVILETAQRLFKERQRNMEKKRMPYKE